MLQGEEDFCNSVSMLLPFGEWTLIDVEDFEWACQKYWRVIRTGKPVGESKERVKRVATAVGGVTVYLHRELMNPPAGTIVGHKNYVALDNRKRNLSVLTAREATLRNRGKSNSSSRFKGVAWCQKSKKWKIITGPAKKKVYLGSFDCEIEAARVYNEYAKTHFGPAAFLNPV